MLARFARNYVERHRDRRNQLLHVIGLPVTFVLPVILLLNGNAFWAAAAFVVGYALQFWGHAFEGNDAGEVILIKKLLGRPYVEFGPAPRQPNQSKNDG